AHTTAADALWAGVPVLSCRGDSFASRVGASLLTAAGLPDLICGTLEEYRSRALQLARSRTSLDSLRARLLAGRASAAVFDMELYTRSLEDLYHSIWTAHAPAATVS